MKNPITHYIDFRGLFLDLIGEHWDDICRHRFEADHLNSLYDCNYGAFFAQLGTLRACWVAWRGTPAVTGS